MIIMYLKDLLQRHAIKTAKKKVKSYVHFTKNLFSVSVTYKYDSQNKINS